MSDDYKHERTRFGFNWGPVTVERATSDRKHGVWLHIRTGKNLVSIRATPSGLLRVGVIEKDFNRER